MIEFEKEASQLKVCQGAQELAWRPPRPRTVRL